MRTTLTIIIPFGILCGCSSSIHFTREQKRLFECRDGWQYFTLKDTLYGELIYQQNIGKYCGTEAFGSNTVVKISSGDTLRIIELCNSNEFKPGDKIKIVPATKPSFGVVISQSQFDCEIKKTCYGVVSKIK